jgi:hypothetical protein
VTRTLSALISRLCAFFRQNERFAPKASADNIANQSRAGRRPSSPSRKDLLFDYSIATCILEASRIISPLRLTRANVIPTARISRQDRASELQGLSYLMCTIKAAISQSLTLLQCCLGDKSNYPQPPKQRVINKYLKEKARLCITGTGELTALLPPLTFH